MAVTENVEIARLQCRIQELQMFQIVRFMIFVLFVVVPSVGFAQGTFTNHGGDTRWHLDKDYAAEMHAASERRHVPRGIIMISVCPLYETTNGVRARKMVGDRCVDDIEWKVYEGTKLGAWRRLWGMAPVHGWYAVNLNGVGRYRKFFRTVGPPDLPGDEVMVVYATPAPSAPTAMAADGVFTEDLFANLPTEASDFEAVPDYGVPAPTSFEAVSDY